MPSYIIISAGHVLGRPQRGWTSNQPVYSSDIYPQPPSWLTHTHTHTPTPTHANTHMHARAHTHSRVISDDGDKSAKGGKHSLSPSSINDGDRPKERARDSSRPNDDEVQLGPGHQRVMKKQKKNKNKKRKTQRRLCTCPRIYYTSRPVMASLTVFPSEIICTRNPVF